MSRIRFCDIVSISSLYVFHSDDVADKDGDMTLVPGLRCEDDDACVSNPCRLGASCETLPANGSYQCVCETGWTGRDCDVDVDECSESTYTKLAISSLSQSHHVFFGLPFCLTPSVTIIIYK